MQLLQARTLRLDRGVLAKEHNGLRETSGDPGTHT